MGKIMMNGIQYGVGGIEQAKDISYDNTESGATATDVQGALDELNAGLSDLGNPVLIGTSATNPTSWTNFNLSESMANFKYLIIVLQRNAEQILASVTIPIDDIVVNYESWVAIYITSSWRCAMKYKKVSDTQMSAIVDERAGFSGYLNVYGMK